MKNSEYLSKEKNRRQAIKGGLSVLAVALMPTAASAIGPAGRNADRMRRTIRKRHSVVAYHAATARQRAAAIASARKIQAKYRKQWERTPKGKAAVKAQGGGSSGGGLFKKPTSQSTVVSAQTPMRVVVADLGKPPVVAVKVPTASAGARAAVLPVDLRTGGLVGNGVVEMASAPRAGSSITQQVKAAREDGTINGGGEWLRGDIVLASL